MLDTSTHTRVNAWNAFGQNHEPNNLIPRQTQKLSTFDTKFIVDVLSVSAWSETYGQTLAYRWKGADTFTWGNLDEWIQIHWLRNWFWRYQERNSKTLEQEKALREIIQSAKFARLETMYTIRNEYVKIFLMEHPQLMQLLFEAKVVLGNYFGSDDVSLDLILDPDMEKFQQLFVYITTKLSPSEAIDCLNKFDDEWFLKRVNLSDGLINFNLESV